MRTHRRVLASSLATSALATFTAAAALAAALAAPARGQTLYALSPGPVPLVTELSGPPGPPCGYPAGPVALAFPALGALCPGLGPFAAPAGDVATDAATDVVYATDGGVIAAYTAAGVPLGIGAPPIPGLTGLGMGAAGLLWITDGFAYGAVPAAAIGCPAPVLPFAVGPFPVPIGPIFAGPIGDIDFEPASGSLIACDAFGIVGSFLPGPIPAPGPYGAFPLPPFPCVVAPALVGVAFDDAAPLTGIVFVTDGALIQRVLPGGAPAPPTFYFPLPCIPIPAPLPIAGLAFAGRGLPYGAGGDSSGLPAPAIGSIGQSWLGNPGFAVTLAGSVPGSRALLRMARAPACPALAVRGVPWLLATRPFLGFSSPGLSGPGFFVASLPTSPAGGALYAAPLPPALGPGATYFVEWLVRTPGSYQTTPGLAFTTTMP